MERFKSTYCLVNDKDEKLWAHSLLIDADIRPGSTLRVLSKKIAVSLPFLTLVDTINNRLLDYGYDENNTIEMYISMYLSSSKLAVNKMRLKSYVVTEPGSDVAFDIKKSLKELGIQAGVRLEVKKKKTKELQGSSISISDKSSLVLSPSSPRSPSEPAEPTSPISPVSPSSPRSIDRKSVV